MSELISVKDRLPETEDDVLTWIGHRYRVDNFYLDSKSFGWDTVTHWMPLPDPPAPSQPTGEPSDGSM